MRAQPFYSSQFALTERRTQIEDRANLEFTSSMQADAGSILKSVARGEVATVFGESTLTSLGQTLPGIVQCHFLTVSGALGGVSDPILAAHKAQLLLWTGALDGTALGSAIGPAPAHRLPGRLVHLGGAPGQPIH